MKKRIVLWIVMACLSQFAMAHESRPLYVEMTIDSNLLQVQVNLPNTVNTMNFPLIYLDTIALNAQRNWKSSTSSFSQNFTCPAPHASLQGRSIKIQYPLFNPVLSSIVALTFADGEQHILVLPPDESELVIPTEFKAVAVRTQYCLLGIEHIWAGIDHLLFVVCLLIITGFSRKLLVTITGFTLAHSITLVLSALGVIQLPIPPIEATIALSIVFLCYEIIHHHQEKTSLTYQHPILVASSFGLLHGLGFAAVLGEIGLPSKYQLEALLFFNVGVELGQLIFLAVLFLLTWLGNYVAKRSLTKSQIERSTAIGLQGSIYFVGILAAYWMFDRILM